MRTIGILTHTWVFVVSLFSSESCSILDAFRFRCTHRCPGDTVKIRTFDIFERDDGRGRRARAWAVAERSDIQRTGPVTLARTHLHTPFSYTRGPTSPDQQAPNRESMIYGKRRMSIDAAILVTQQITCATCALV